MESQAKIARFQFSVGEAEHAFSVELTSALPTFIVGKNGAGKSALIQSIVRHNHPLMHYFPGARSVSLSADRLSITEDARALLTQHFISWNEQPQQRYRVINPTQRNDASIYDLQSAEVVDGRGRLSELMESVDIEACRQSLRDRHGPLMRINSILALANFPVRLEADGAQLVARKGEATFSLAKMSDGERSAVFLAADMVTAQPGSLFVIDEPEVHLHKSIASPLIAALIAERPDCAFLISTHDLELVASFEHSRVLIVRGVTWSNGDIPIDWIIDVLDGASELSERDRADLMGARRRILFVEGNETTSLDLPLYELLLPSVTIVPRNGCREVKEAVAGLQANKELHWLEAFGIVDNDGQQPTALAGVFQTGTNAIEGLYYSPAAIQAVAEVMARTHGFNAADLVSGARDAALRSLNSASIDHLAARIAERHVRDAVLVAMPSRDQIANGNQVEVRVNNSYSQVRAELQGFIHQANLADVVRNYPIKFSGVPGAIARALHLASKEDYQRVLLQQVSERLELRNQLRRELGVVAEAMNVMERA